MISVCGGITIESKGVMCYVDGRDAILPMFQRGMY